MSRARRGIVSVLTRDPQHLHLEPLPDSMGTAPEATLADLRRNAAGLPLLVGRTRPIRCA